MREFDKHGVWPKSFWGAVKLAAGVMAVIVAASLFFSLLAGWPG